MSIFDALCDAPAAEQKARVAELRGDEPELAARLDRMLAADQAPPDHLDEPGAAARLVLGFAGTVVAGRWRLRERLGRGGGGEVWRAEALDGGPDTAVKLIDPALMESPRQVRRFRREFRALSRLDHEGCVRALAEGALEVDTPLGPGTRRFIVMEFVGGGDLTRLARAPEATLLPVVLQIAVALDYIHRQQIVHRDLKPANVLLTADDPPHVKLADFGVIKLADPQGSQITDGGALIGTLDYLSPEQVRGEPADPRSDLYALGCLIHALWAGDVPFGGNRMERLWARVGADAPPLASRAPHATPALCALTDELLRAEPDRRPPTASDVARRLFALLPTLPEASTRGGTHALPIGHGAFLFPPGVVGRDDTLAALVDEAAAARATTSPRLVALVAAAGLGKTTVASALSRRLNADGWFTLSIPSRAELGQAPFAPLSTLAARLATLAPSPPDDRDRAPSPAERAAARPDHATAQAQRELADAIGTRLAALCETRPACLVLEDVHDASDGALDVLSELLAVATSRALPLLVLATGRPASRDALDAIASARVIDLEPLNDADATRVVARILGAATSELPDALSRPLVAEAGGSPLLLRTAVRDLAEAGGLRRTGDVWVVEGEIATRQAITDLLAKRLAALSATTRDVMAVAAVIGHHFDADLLAAAAAVDEEALLDALSDAIRAAVITPDTSTDAAASANGTARGDSYRFDHARLAELAVSQLGARRALVHDAVGEVLLARGAPVATLAHHFGQGSDPRRALEHLEAAVAEAEAAHDQAVVARHLARMLERLDELDPPGVHEDGDLDATRRALNERRADALVSTGHLDEAAALLHDLERSAPTPLDRGRLMRKRGQALLRTAEPGRGLATLGGALAVLGDRTPRTRVVRLARLSWDFVVAALRLALPARELTAGRLERAHAHRELALMNRWVDLYDSAAHLARFNRLAGRRAPAELRVDAKAMTAMLFALRSMPGAGATLQTRARELARSTGDLFGLARLTIIQGGCEAMLEDAETALERMDDGVSLAERTGDRWLVCFARSQRAWVRGLVGSVPEAHAEFVEAEALARDVDAAWLVADAMAGRMLSALVVGRVAEGERTARELLTSDVRLAFPVFEQLAVEGMAGVAFISGRFDAAATGYERALTLLRRHRLDEGWGWLLPMELLEATCCLADQSGAASVPRLGRRLKAARRAMRRMTRLPLYRGCDQVARGVIAARRGRADAAHASFDEATTARGEVRRSYMDTWFLVRPALERLQLGAPRDEVGASLDAVAHEYDRLGLEGLRGWLGVMREIHDV